MSDPTVQEQGTFPAENMVSSFFSDKPTDLRFTKVAYQQIVPHTAVDANSKNIEFILEKLDSPFCYLVSDMLMQANVIITKEDGVTLPDSTSEIGPSNNLLSTLFSSCIMKINDDIITASGELYPYKCYVSKILTYSAETKMCHFFTSGYVQDFDSLTGSIEATSSNVGWLFRSQMFRTNYGADTPYRPEGVTLVGPFEHELSNCEKCLPPSTKVSFNLIRSSDEFSLMKQIDSESGEDTNKYKLLLTSCSLFVKVGTMSEPIYRELSARFEKEDLKYQYRKVIVKAITVPPFNQEFLTGNLFPDSETPFRIHFFLVKSEAKNGSYKTNPFGFYRKWKIPASVSQTNMAAEVENVFLRQKVESLSNKVDTQMTMFQQFFEMYKLQQSQGAASSDSTTVLPEPTASTSRANLPQVNLVGRKAKNTLGSPLNLSSFTTRALRERKNLKGKAKKSKSSLNETALDNENDTISESSFVTCNTDNLRQSMNAVQEDTEKIVYLKNFDLEINSAPLDQVTQICYCNF